MSHHWDVPGVQLWTRDFLGEFLAAHPNVADAIVWYYPAPGAGSPKRYADWPSGDQVRLKQVFAQMSAGRWMPLSAMPPVVTVTPAAAMGYDAGIAHEYYIAYVAHSLMLETKGRLPWSIVEYSADQLAMLLNGQSFYLYDSFSAKYLLQVDSFVDSVSDWTYWPGGVTPGDPLYAYGFLHDERCIAATQRGTIERLLDWCRGNLSHYAGGMDQANLQAHWHYDGWPPVSFIIRGTVHPQNGFAHWTMGCHGTTGFLRTVLKTVNIPSYARGSPNHALMAFPTEGLYLSHGDDPYDRGCKTVPPIPIGEYFIGQAVFDRWFALDLDPLERYDNVGRRTTELMLEYLTDWLLAARCRDVANGVTDAAASEVYSNLSPHYTIAQLKAIDLWGRLDARIQARGGCANIPAP